MRWENPAAVFHAANGAPGLMKTALSSGRFGSVGLRLTAEDGWLISSQSAQRNTGEAPQTKLMKLTVAPLTPDRWPDLEAIFNAKGCSVARGCWCMAYRLSGSAQSLPSGMTRAQSNHAALKALVDAGSPPGLIGYRGKVPVGWVSIGPREEYAKLRRSPVMKAVDDQPVWSIICFVVPAQYRGQGVAGRFSRELWRMPRNRAPRWLRPTPSTNLYVPTTITCGSERSPCMTKQVSRK